MVTQCRFVAIMRAGIKGEQGMGLWRTLGTFFISSLRTYPLS